MPLKGKNMSYVIGFSIPAGWKADEMGGVGAAMLNYEFQTSLEDQMSNYIEGTKCATSLGSHTRYRCPSGFVQQTCIIVQLWREARRGILSLFHCPSATCVRFLFLGLAFSSFQLFYRKPGCIREALSSIMQH